MSGRLNNNYIMNQLQVVICTDIILATVSCLVEFDTERLLHIQLASELIIISCLVSCKQLGFQRIKYKPYNTPH